MSYSSSRRARLMGGAAVGLALLCSGSLAHAQQAAATEGLNSDARQTAEDQSSQVEEVVVTGIRRGIEDSIAAKRQNTSIVEVVSAEDIGKLPDVSIAESLARLPGLTAQRLDGRSQVISIRGLAPDFTTALLNGREQVSTGDNRGVEFDQYPSELLSGVVVYKTPDAALIGQGLAGTADLRTVRPLDYGRRAVAVNARYEWNDIGALNEGTSDDGERYSISYIDQFLDDRLGIVLGYAHITSPYQAERFNAWGYPDDRPGAAPARVIGGAKPYVQSSELERDGYLATIEFQPNDRIETSLDAFYSEFKNTQILRGIEFPLAWGGSSGSRPAPLLRNPVVANGLVTAGTFDNVKGVVRNDGNRRESELLSVGWNTQVELTEAWSAVLDVNYSKVERSDQILETYSGTGRDQLGALDSLGFVSRNDGTRFRPTLNYADYNLIGLTSPQGWGGDVVPGGQDGYSNSPSIEDELKAVRLSATRAFEGYAISDIEFGVNLNKREKALTAQQFYLSVKGAPGLVPIPTQFRLGVTELDYLGIPGMVSYDPFALYGGGVYNLIRNPNADVAAQDWVVEEKVNTVFVKTNLDTTLFQMPLTGNIGFQVVETEQESTGFAAQPPTGGSTVFTAPVSGGADYLEVLPSLNLILEFAEDQYLRLGAARTLARPRMDQMRASSLYSFDAGKVGNADLNGSPWSGSGGNPDLRPWIANSYDLSYEKYFGERAAYVSVAAFFKDLETYVYDRTEVRDFTGFPTGGVIPATFQGLVTTPQNGEGGEIYGVEFAFSAPFSLLHPLLEGFGVIASMSLTESKIQPNPGDPATPIPGLSETVGNLTLYYERAGFQARISERYRSDFLGEVSGFGNSRTYRQVKEEEVVDAQIGYEFQNGPLERLGVLFQVNNLTDEPFITYEGGDERRVIDHQTYGRSFLVGVNYRF